MDGAVVAGRLSDIYMFNYFIYATYITNQNLDKPKVSPQIDKLLESYITYILINFGVLSES